MKVAHVIGILVVVAAHQCFAASNCSSQNPHWDALKVTWGRNYSNSYVFADMPRHESEAIQQNFTKISNCTHHLFLGNRYVKDDDYAVILIYDSNGYIAGIQAGFNESQPYNYPSDYLKEHPLISDGGRYYITAYFVDPKIICTGRAAADFHEQGTGSDLYIQDCSNPYNAIKQSRWEVDLNNTSWGNSKCVPTMGHHYWYNIRLDMSCDEFFPLFLLYHQGELIGFSWAFGINLLSPRIEHPDKNMFQYFMKIVPTCLYQPQPISTLHVFLKGDPRKIKCV